MTQNYPRTERQKEFDEKVIEIDRISRTVKGGRRIRFRALVIIGNRNGKVGYGVGKGEDVLTSIKKAVTLAKKNLINILIINETIPQEINEHYGSAKILLKPAKQGTSVIAGGVIRVIAELSGIKNLVAKSLGSANKINNTKATFSALQKISNRE